MIAPVLERIGNCRILDEIASGGMAVVYKAVQESLNRTVAVKALKTSVAAESQFAIRFEREALSLAQLQHENIIHVYDFYKERGAFFIVMEYVEGVDLYDLLDRCGRLPIDVAGVIAMQVARALDYAHYRGIIHRDIKPANIMASRSGGVKLMDFGIARDQSFGDLTETGTGLGTPSYMSPEQILGDKLDYRSDLFSLGIVLYQMVTGRKPFIEDEQKSVMHKIRLERYTPARKLNPEIPRELERIMGKCMAKLPRDRWRSTQDLVLALERFLARHVEMNYHARLVLFLKNQGVIGAEEAEQFLHPAHSSTGAQVTPSHAAGRVLVRRVATTQGGIAAAVALMVALIHLAPVGRTSADAPVLAGQQTGSVGPGVPDKARARVRLVVNPWAEVLVGDEAEARLIAPSSSALELEEGEHTITFRNPYFESRVEKVTIGADDAKAGRRLVVELTARKGAKVPEVQLGKPRAAVDPTAIEQRPDVTHAVAKGDTLELLAAQYYAERQYAVFLMAANSITHDRELVVGETLVVPTAWKYRAAEGDTLAGLAARYLEDERRGPFLATFQANRMDAGIVLAAGQEVMIPFHVPHVAAGTETLADIALAYYADGSKADLLKGYNFRGNKPLGKGDKILVPTVNVSIRAEKLPPPDPDVAARERKRANMALAVKDALPTARSAWDEGNYAAVRDALVGLENEYLDATNAAQVAFLLGSAYVALGEEAPALAQFRKIAERKPGFRVKLSEASPRVVELLLQLPDSTKLDP